MKNSIGQVFSNVRLDLQATMANVNSRKVIIAAIPYIIIFYIADKLHWLYRFCSGQDLIGKVVVLISNWQKAFDPIWPSIYPQDILFGICAALVFGAVIWYRRQNAKHYRHGIEYGSARWGTAKDIAPFVDPIYENNILLTATERLTLNGRPKKPVYARNKNVIIIGGSGSGKTRFYVKPQLMQMPEKVSFVVTDPKASLVIECGKMLVNGGYRVKVFNTINFRKSMHYNPFHYIHSEKDILKLVNTIIANTKGEGEKSTEDFWVKAERLLFCALIGFIWYEAPEQEQNFSTLLELLNASETREDDETFKNAVDLLFEDLETEQPEHFAVRQYKKYKLAAGKTAKSILISCGARLAPFDIAELREIMSYDELELDMIGDQRTALFIIISDTFEQFASRCRRLRLLTPPPSICIRMPYHPKTGLAIQETDDILVLIEQLYVPLPHQGSSDRQRCQFRTTTVVLPLLFAQIIFVEQCLRLRVVLYEIVGEFRTHGQEHLPLFLLQAPVDLLHFLCLPRFLYGKVLRNRFHIDLLGCGATWCGELPSVHDLVIPQLLFNLLHRLDPDSLPERISLGQEIDAQGLFHFR